MTFKNINGLYFSFSMYNGRRSALMHMMKFDEKNALVLKKWTNKKKDDWATQVNYSSKKIWD